MIGTAEVLRRTGSAHTCLEEEEAEEEEAAGGISGVLNRVVCMVEVLALVFVWLRLSFKSSQGSVVR